MSTDKQSAGPYNGGPNKTRNKELSSPSQEGYIKTNGGQRERAESTRGIVHLRFYQFVLKIRLLSIFLKFSVLVLFFKKYPFIPQSAVFPLAMCSCK